MKPQLVQKSIDSSGRATSSRSKYLSAVSARYGRQLRTRSLQRLASGEETTSEVIEVGDHPDGFGQSLVWDRKTKEMLAVIFINPQDPLGVSIQGLKRGDRIQVTSASGIASFTKDEGNPLASGIVTLVAAGAKVAATAAGHPEAAPLVDAAENFAKDQFKATNAKHKRRDAFGVDPGTGHKARQEGGVLVSLPLANGPFYSGNGSHKDRWVKKPGNRHDENRPDHINDAFFVVRGDPVHNSRTLRGSGEIYVTAWDHRFDDNAGYYKLYIKVVRGNLEEEAPVIN